MLYFSASELAMYNSRHKMIWQIGILISIINQLHLIRCNGEAGPVVDKDKSLVISYDEDFQLQLQTSSLEQTSSSTSILFPHHTDSTFSFTSQTSLKNKINESVQLIIDLLNTQLSGCFKVFSRIRICKF